MNKHQLKSFDGSYKYTDKAGRFHACECDKCKQSRQASIVEHIKRNEPYLRSKLK